MNKDFMGDLVTFGLGDAYDKYAYNSYLHEKINKGEPLTEKEQLVAESLAGIHETTGMEMEQTGAYGITSGTFESLQFLIGGAPGRLAMKGATKLLNIGTQLEFYIKNLEDYIMIEFFV